MMFTSQAEGMPLNTVNGNGSETVKWGISNGIGRDLITGRPWRRASPTPFLYEDNGLYGPQYYKSNKHGKLIDARLYKSHIWVYYCNSEPNVPWESFSNAVGNFDPINIGKIKGENRYTIGDTAIVFSMEDVK